MPLEENPLQNTLLNHEVLHTAGIVEDMFDRHILEHEAVNKNPRLLKEASKISKLLGEFYQSCGGVSLATKS